MSTNRQRKAFIISGRTTKPYLSVHPRMATHQIYMTSLHTNLRLLSYSCTVIICLIINLVVIGASAQNDMRHQLTLPSIIQHHKHFYIVSHVKRSWWNSISLRGGSHDKDPLDHSPVVDNDQAAANVTLNKESSLPKSLSTSTEGENSMETYFEDFVPNEFRLQEENQIFEAEEAHFPDNFPDTDVEGDDFYNRDNQDILTAMAMEEEKFPETFPDTDVDGGDVNPLQRDTTDNILPTAVGQDSRINEQDEISIQRTQASSGISIHNQTIQDTGYDTTPFASASTNLPGDEDSSAYLDRMDLADAYDDEESDNKDIKEALDEMSATTQSVVNNAILLNQEVGSRVQENEVITVDDDHDDDSSAKIQFMITEHMKRVLIDELGYSKIEVIYESVALLVLKDGSLSISYNSLIFSLQKVENMKPDVATVLVNKMLKCPKNGMPDAFYIEGRIPKAISKRDIQFFGISKVVITRAIIPAFVIGVTWGLTILFGGSSTQSTYSLSQGKKGKYGKRGKKGKKVSKKGSKKSPKGHAQGKKSTKAKDTISSNKSPISSDMASDGNTVSLTHGVSLEANREVATFNSTNALMGTRKVAKDLDKTWLDRVITTTLEKLDDIFKRPF